MDANPARVALARVVIIRVLRSSGAENLTVFLVAPRWHRIRSDS